MYWNRTTAAVERKEKSLSSINHNEDSTIIDVMASRNPPVGQSSPLTRKSNAPPSYQALRGSNASPPGNNSMSDHIREAYNDSDDAFDFFNKVVIVIMSTIGCAIGLGLFLAIPISMIVIGGVYFYDCPLNNYIPIYLVVSGSLAVLERLISYTRAMCQTQEGKNWYIQNLLGFVIFVWFIAGSVLVYKEYEPNYDPFLEKYCNKTLYLFAFWQLTASYICLIILIFVSCCLACLSNAS